MTKRMATRLTPFNILDPEFQDVLFTILELLPAAQLYQMRVISTQARDIIVEVFRRKSRYPEMYLNADVHVDIPDNTLPHSDSKLQARTDAKQLYRKVISDFYLTCKHKQRLYAKQMGAAANTDVVKIYTSIIAISQSAAANLFHGACKYGNLEVVRYMINTYPHIARISISTRMHNYLYFTARGGKANFVNVIKIISDQHVIHYQSQMLLGACISGDAAWVGELLTFDNILGVLSSDCMNRAYEHGRYEVCKLLSTVMVPPKETFALACKQENTKYIKLWINMVLVSVLEYNLFISIDNGKFTTVKFLIDNYRYSDETITKALGILMQVSIEMFDWLVTYVHDNRSSNDIFKYLILKFISIDAASHIEYLRNGYRANNVWLDTYTKTMQITKNITHSINLHEYLCVKFIGSLVYDKEYYDTNMENMYALCMERGYNVNLVFVK